MKLVRLLLGLLFCSSIANAQLADFNLALSKTDETCLSNGSITFSLSGLTQGSTVLYKVYKLPNISSPVSILSDNYLGGLSAATYKVVAVQALGDDFNTKESQVTIQNLIQPFAISVSSNNLNCASGGNIIVNATQGIAAQYEIISGPETRPLQSSNIFEGLPSGTYNIRAFNNCGVGKVKTHTLTVVSSQLSISDPVFTEGASTFCDSVAVTNVIAATSGSIAYPVTVQHRLDAMDIGGNEIVINQTFDSGPADAFEVSAVLPRYNVSYTYELSVTDNCNALYEKTDNIVSHELGLSFVTANAPCGEEYLIVNVSGYVNSYSIEFLTAPNGFNALDYNAAANNDFTQPVVEFGDASNPVPFGYYVIKVTDECGRSAIKPLDVEINVPTPVANGRNNGCFSEFGRIRINVPNSHLVSATIIATDSPYNGTLPQNVTSNINNSGVLALNNMPVGFYTIVFTDDCGFSYEETIEVPPFLEKPFTENTLVACEAGYGSVMLRSGNGDLTEVMVTVAPPAYSQMYQSDVTANIFGGRFYMGNLPQGDYVFTATDECGIVNDMPVYIEGYNPPAQGSFIFTPNCGSFSVKVTDSSNGLEGATFWLQKLDTSTGQWVHPQTGVVYTEGASPDSETGIRLNNNTERNNLNYSGKFRILKRFETYTTASNESTICISELGQFEYNDVLVINSAYTMACVGEPNDVYVEVTGYPVSYKITQKDGEPFMVDNGADNIFRGLAPAEYVISVEDACGNVVTQWLNFQELPSIAAANQPDDMVICAEPGSDDTAEFHLTDQNDAILGPLFGAMYTITYHATQADAESGLNPLPEYYTNIYNGQVIYVRLKHNEIDICHSTTSFRLFVGEYQQPHIDSKGTVCDGIALELTAEDGYSSYLWSTGETTQTIYVTEPGLYTVIVEKNYGTGKCDGFAEIEIFASEQPEITSIDTKDWTRDENSITVHIKGEGRYEYSIDGFNYQESNVFEDLETGVYQVFVRDLNGCGMDIEEVVLLHYPNYFTPNGDGVHDKWYIKYAIKEPNLKVQIYDRYGKMITAFGATSDGWDGTFNGLSLPSTDYWFVVTRQDGREYRGHFAMVR
jgi:gliding motility-associated-like protein